MHVLWSRLYISVSSVLWVRVFQAHYSGYYAKDAHRLQSFESWCGESRLRREHRVSTEKYVPP